MNDDRSVLIELKEQHKIKLGLGDGYELPGWAEDMVDKALQQPDFRAEVAALRAQFHTQAEQRDFVGKLIENMPHAQIAAEFKEFKAEVAAALAELRAEIYDAMQTATTSNQWLTILARIGERLHSMPGEIGLTPKEKSE